MAKKLKAEGRVLLRNSGNHKFPEFNIMDYKLSMIKSLNFYSLEVENKDKMQYALAYWKSLDKDIKGLDKLHPSWFSTIGALCHMIHKRQLPIDEFDVSRLESAYDGLMDEVKKITADVAPKAVVTVQDRIEDVAKQHIGEIEGAVDQFIFENKEFDVKAYLTSNGVKAPVAKKIGEWFKTKLPELKEAYVGEDKDLKDAYSHLGKRGLKRSIDFIEGLVDSCGHVAIIAKTTRAPRKRKPQPPSKLVMKMKWCKEFADLGMKSQFPERIIGSTEVWLYDTIKRRLARYVASEGNELSVKGTTLLNWDPVKSGSKIIRKPDILSGHDGWTKRPMNNLFNEIKSTLGKVNGRTNESQIILKVF
jgi:hypothetical protein